MSDMPPRRPPHLHRETSRHGKTVWYYRRGKGKRTRIDEPYGSEAFWRAYDHADRGERLEPAITSSKGTLGWLIERYLDSSAFTAELSQGTQKARRPIFEKLVATGGDKKLANITANTIMQGREDRKQKPHSANNWLRALKGLFKWAKAAKLVDIDPAQEITKIKVAEKPRKDWPLELVQLYCEHHEIGTRARLAIDLLLYTGLSRDIVRLMRTHIQNGFFDLARAKTGVEVNVWICPALEASIQATPSADLYILPSPRGGSWSPASFGNYFRKWADEAGVPVGYTAHGLRRAGATLAAENGATHAELMAMFGWTDEQMASYYIRRANQRKLAKEAGRKLSENVLFPHLGPSVPAPKKSGS